MVVLEGATLGLEEEEENPDGLELQLYVSFLFAAPPMLMLSPLHIVVLLITEGAGFCRTVKVTESVLEQFAVLVVSVTVR